MTVAIAGLRVDEELAAFVAEELLPGLDLEPEVWWRGLAGLQEAFEVPLQRLLDRRDVLQAALDEWHGASAAPEVADYERFLTGIGYLVPNPGAVSVDVRGVDAEIASVAGPQLVVPSTVPRYALNAANARWGSLFDALYGTAALPLDHNLVPGYDERRGAQVIAAADQLLDELFPLAGTSHAEVTEYSVADGVLSVRTLAGTSGLVDASQFVGHGDATILLARHGLHVELSVDPRSRVGRSHHAGVADVLVEAAVTTIVDLEDSVATVDGADKVVAYRTWLGLMTGALDATFVKGGQTVVRTQADDRRYVAPDGTELVLPGRALLLVRTVGHHMRTDAVRTSGGAELAEGLLDALVAATAALHDLRGLGWVRNSRTGSIYLVKPKQHGPEEVALSVEMLAAVEDLLGLPPTTIKVGIMDEEKRSSLNLEACIAAARDRVIFINTGFLDRTGDEMHTAMHAGPMRRKGDMKSSEWIAAYERNNVLVGLACGLRGKAQIGKGMWAMPDLMAAMLEQKIAHPKAGANTAWVPSPTAATLHALHYHQVDVAAVQRELEAGDAAAQHDALLTGLLTVPVATPEMAAGWTDADKQ
ncbi:MAG TPA: malate synthase G, partial [Propionicimonas sp.]|nr:malate synthase G [Propionicimonas sp.]